jgi:hypothetical protein
MEYSFASHASCNTTCATFLFSSLFLTWLFMQLSIPKVRIGGRKTKYRLMPIGSRVWMQCVKVQDSWDETTKLKPGTCNTHGRVLQYSEPGNRQLVTRFNYLRTELCIIYFAVCCFVFPLNQSIILP